jgi:hypothetical protein
MRAVTDFTREISHKENNKESQEHFKENEKHFSNQCKKVYEAFLRGERLTTVSALLKYQIGDLRRRVKDLKDYHKINVKDEWVKVNESRFKEYYV